MTLKKILGFLAIAGLLFVAAPTKPAQALSLLNPAAAAAVHADGEKLVTDVRWRRHYGFRRHFGFRPYYGFRRHYGWHRHHRWHRRGW